MSVKFTIIGLSGFLLCICCSVVSLADNLNNIDASATRYLESSFRINLRATRIVGDKRDLDFEWSLSNGRKLASGFDEFVELPPGIYDIVLTVLQQGKRLGQDTTRVEVTDRKHPMIDIKKGQGHTVSRGSRVPFYVSLESPPYDDVKISVISSDSKQGTPRQSQLVFTPENWEQEQELIVSGVAEKYDNPKQDYWIRFLPVESTDTGYAGIDPPDFRMEGLLLNFLEPDFMPVLIPGRRWHHEIKSDYTGVSSYSSALITAPKGMKLDVNGDVFWTPAETQSGTHSITVFATNDQLPHAKNIKDSPIQEKSNPLTVSDSLTFQIHVAQLESIEHTTEDGFFVLKSQYEYLNGVMLKPRFDDLKSLEFKIIKPSSTHPELLNGRSSDASPVFFATNMNVSQRRAAVSVWYPVNGPNKGKNNKTKVFQLYTPLISHRPRIKKIVQPKHKRIDYWKDRPFYVFDYILADEPTYLDVEVFRFYNLDTKDSE